MSADKYDTTFCQGVIHVTMVTAFAKVNGYRLFDPVQASARNKDRHPIIHSFPPSFARPLRLTRNNRLPRSTVDPRAYVDAPHRPSRSTYHYSRIPSKQEQEGEDDFLPH